MVIPFKNTQIIHINIITIFKGDIFRLNPVVYVPPLVTPLEYATKFKNSFIIQCSHSTVCKEKLNFLLQLVFPLDRIVVSNVVYVPLVVYVPSYIKIPNIFAIVHIIIVWCIKNNWMITQLQFKMIINSIILIYLDSSIHCYILYNILYTYEYSSLRINCLPR